MHQQFTLEEVSRLDAHRAAHASVPVHSSFRRHRRLRRWLLGLRDRYRVQVIDLRTPAERGLHDPAHVTPARDRMVLPEFIDLTEPPVEPGYPEHPEQPHPPGELPVQFIEDLAHAYATPRRDVVRLSGCPVDGREPVGTDHIANVGEVTTRIHVAGTNDRLLGATFDLDHLPRQRRLAGWPHRASRQVRRRQSRWRSSAQTPEPA